MALLCVKCQGPAVYAARTKTFSYRGETLHCIERISSCMSCGYRCEDDMHAAENARNVERACEAAAAPG